LEEDFLGPLNLKKFLGILEPNLTPKGNFPTQDRPLSLPRSGNWNPQPNKPISLPKTAFGFPEEVGIHPRMGVIWKELKGLYENFPPLLKGDLDWI